MDGDEEDRCTACNEKFDSDRYYVCDSCMRKIHMTCMNLTASEAKCMPLQKRMLLLVCNDCRKLLIRLPTVIKVLDEIKQDIREIRNRNQTAENIGIPVKSYADMLTSGTKNTEERKQSTQTLIIRPKNKQEAKKTQDKIHHSINPTQLKVGISSLRTTKQGAVVLKCPTKQEVGILKEAAENSMGDLYQIEVPKKKLPRVKIIGYTGAKSAGELESAVRGQNNWVDEKDEFKITYLKKLKKKEETTIFAECSPSLFRKMVGMKRVYIDWERCAVYEDLQVIRCFNCQGFYHKGGTCDKRKTCSNCAGEHDRSACQSRVRRCHNCMVANSLHKTEYNTEHAVNDPVCPSYRYHIEVLKSKIDYSP